MTDLCPGCGRPMSEHEDVLELQIDLYQVIARWLCGYGAARGEPLPNDTSLEEVAAALRVRLADDPERQRLILAARLTTEYVGDQILGQYEFYDLKKVRGHA